MEIHSESGAKQSLQHILLDEGVEEEESSSSGPWCRTSVILTPMMLFLATCQLRLSTCLLLSLSISLLCSLRWLYCLSSKNAAACYSSKCLRLMKKYIKWRWRWDVSISIYPIAKASQQRPIPILVPLFFLLFLFCFGFDFSVPWLLLLWKKSAQLTNWFFICWCCSVKWFCLFLPPHTFFSQISIFLNNFYWIQNFCDFFCNISGWFSHFFHTFSRNSHARNKCYCRRDEIHLTSRRMWSYQ